MFRWLSWCFGEAVPGWGAGSGDRDAASVSLLLICCTAVAQTGKVLGDNTKKGRSPGESHTRWQPSRPQEGTLQP